MNYMSVRASYNSWKTFAERRKNTMEFTIDAVASEVELENFMEIEVMEESFATAASSN